jgi:RimJ/RimL family protein N-acetyltransferase
MTIQESSPDDVLARGDIVALRRISPSDLAQISRFGFTVSIREPLVELLTLARAFEVSGFWDEDAGAVAGVDAATGQLLGTSQFYRSAPCIHGLELGYIIHEPAERRRGAASEAVRLFSDYLFANRPNYYRLQLVIETWNVPSWKLAERCGFVREGLMRSAGFGAADPADCFLYARTRKDWYEASHSPISLGGVGADGP